MNMFRRDPGPEDKLRRLAEERLGPNQAEVPVSLEGVDLPKLVRELQLRQVELGQKNDDLQRANAELRKTVVRLSELCSTAPQEKTRLPNEENNRPAQPLTHLASYQFEIPEGQVGWSKEMYGIFERDPALGPASVSEHMRAVPPEDRAVMEQALAAAKEGKTFDIEYRIVLPSGRVRIINSVGRGQVSPSGGPTVVFGTVHDITEACQAAKRLRANEEKFRTVVNFTCDFECWIEPNGHFYYASPSCQQITGYAPQEFLDDPELFHRIIHPDDRERVNAHFGNLAPDHHRGVDFRIVTRSGEVRWIGHISQDVYSDEGRWLGRRASNRDITERKQAEQALAEREAILRGFFNTNNLFLSIIELTENDLIYVLANERQARFFGHNSETMAGKSGRELGLPEEYIAFCLDRLRPGAGLDQAITAEAPIFRGGMETWFQFNACALAAGPSGRPRYNIAAVDITDKKRAEESLRRSENRFRNLFQGSSVGMGLIDRRGHLIESNPALREMYGYDDQELRRAIFFDFLVPEDAAACQECFQEMLQGKRDLLRAERRFLRKDGSVGWARISNSAIRDAEGNFVFLVAMLDDITAEKQAREELRRTEEQLLFIARNYRDLILILDAQGKLIYAAPAVSRVMGYAPEEMIGQEAYTFIHPDDRERVKEENQRLIEQRLEGKVELRMRQKNGEYRWMESLCRPEFDAAGRLLRFHTVSRDIHDRTLAEEALRLANRGLEYYRAAIDHMRDYRISVVGRNWRYLMVSPGYFGHKIPENKIIGEEIQKFFSAETFEQVVRPHLQNAFAGEEQHFTHWFDLLGIGSRYVQAAYYPVHDAKGEVDSVVVVNRDLTAAHQAEQEKLERAQFLQILIDAIPSPVFYKDRQGVFRGCNRAFAKAFAIETGNIAGRTLPEILPAEEAAFHAQRDREIFEKGQPQLYESEATFADGQRRRVFVQKAPFFTAAGEVDGLVGVLTDITEQKQVEEQRRLLDERLQQLQKQQSLSVLAGGFAHDFNNLLMVILGNISIIKAELPNENPLAVNLLEVEQAARRGAELTKQMLAYAGHGKIELKDVDLSSLVQDLAHLLDRSISSKAALRLEYGTSLPRFHADKQQLRQLVISLVMNASEALEDRPGNILVRTSCRTLTGEDLARAYLGDQLAEGDYLCLEVSDDGAGMEMETLGKIFDPFFSTKLAGRGLGLTAVLGIVRSHKGTVQVESAPGKGTRVTVLLPVVTKNEPPPEILASGQQKMHPTEQ